MQVAETAGDLEGAGRAKLSVIEELASQTPSQDLARDYEAAVICSGFAGISLGATPTAMANMTAVAKKYGQAHRAFIIVLVSGFFVDIANAIVISRFLAWFG